MRYGNRLLCGLLVAMACLAPAGLFGQVVLPPGLGMPGGGQTVPSPGFDLALSALASGDFTAALEIATREYRGGVRAGGQQWIDSLPKGPERNFYNHWGIPAIAFGGFGLIAACSCVSYYTMPMPTARFSSGNSPYRPRAVSSASFLSLPRP